MGRAVALARSVSEGISYLIFLTGSAVLVGWIFDISALKSVFPGLVTMKVNTALCFILVGIVLWCLQERRIGVKCLRPAVIIGIFLLLLIGSATLYENIYHKDLGIDQLLHKGSTGDILIRTPGRMSVTASFDFVLISLVLMCLSQNQMRYVFGVQCVALASGIFPFITFVGFIYGVMPLYYRESHSYGTAFHTTILFMLTSLGILFLKPDKGFMAQTTCNLIGGKILRWFLPIAIMVPVVNGFLKLWAVKAGVVNDENGILLVTVSNLFISSLYIYILAVLLNYSDCKRIDLEKSIRVEKEFLRNIINTVPDPIFVKDNEHKWILCNSAFSSVIGREIDDLKGKSVKDIFPNDEAEVFWGKDEEVLLEGKENINEEYFTDGEKRKRVISTKKSLFVDDSGNKFIVGVSRDITEQRQMRETLEQNAKQLDLALKEAIRTREVLKSMLEDNNYVRQKLEDRLVDLKRSQNMLIHSEKLASLGRLISEIAHEVNNPLMIISGNAQLSLMAGVTSDYEKSNLEIIVNECQRAKEVIRRVLRFAKPSKGEVKELDICQSIEAVVGILEKQYMLNSNIEIKRKFLESKIYIRVDEQQIQEVFMNLLNNAKEAMPSSGGVITVCTYWAGDFLGIDFVDNGCGMSEDVMSKIFEPFFTTKENGTGIGLAVSYGIIKAHNGEIRFKSEEGKGTVATVLLPLNGGRE